MSNLANQLVVHCERGEQKHPVIAKQVGFLDISIWLSHRSIVLNISKSNHIPKKCSTCNLSYLGKWYHHTPRNSSPNLGLILVPALPHSPNLIHQHILEILNKFFWNKSWISPLLLLWSHSKPPSSLIWTAIKASCFHCCSSILHSLARK